MLYRCLVLIFIFCSTLLFSNHAFSSSNDLSIKLSLNSIIMFALNNNPDIEISWERYSQAQNFIKEAQSKNYPQVNLNIKGEREFRDPSAGTNPANSDATYNGSVGVTLEQALFDGFGIKEEINRRGKLKESSFWKTQSKVEEIMTETIKIYFNVIRYQEEYKTITDLVANIKETIEVIKLQYEVGSVGKAVIDYAESRLSSANTELNKASSSLNDAVSKLEYLTGKLPPGFIASYPEKLEPDKIDLGYYLSLLEKNNSLVVSTDYEIEAMQHQMQVEKAKFFPKFTFEVNANQKHNNGGNIGRERELSAGVRMNYQIFDGFKRQATKKRVNNQINELAIRRNKIIKEHRRDIKLAYNQIRSNVYSLEVTKEEINSSIALKELNKENFELGNINIIELIESSERLNSARLKEIKLFNSMYNNSYKMLLLSSLIDQHFFCETC